MPPLAIIARRKFETARRKPRNHGTKPQAVGRDAQTEGETMVRNLDVFFRDLSDLTSRYLADSPLSESISPSKAASQPPPSSQPPDTPTSHTEPRPASHQRKTGRPPARRGRLGRNQYTRDMPSNGEPGSHNSPMRDVSRDGVDGSPLNGTNGASTNGVSGESGGRTSRPKHLNPNRTTMNELKRRAIAIEGFITRTMDERGNTNTTASGSGEGNTPISNGHTPSSGARALIDGASARLEKVNGQVNTKTTYASPAEEGSNPTLNGKQAIGELSPQDLKTLSVEALLERMKGQLTNFEQLLTK